MALETIKECEARIGRKLSKSERVFKQKLDRMCQCGHSGHAHTAVLLGGPEGAPCWAKDCPCYSFPDGLTLEEKQDGRTARERMQDANEEGVMKEVYGG